MAQMEDDGVVGVTIIIIIIIIIKQDGYSSIVAMAIMAAPMSDGEERECRSSFVMITECVEGCNSMTAVVLVVCEVVRRRPAGRSLLRLRIFGTLVHSLQGKGTYRP